LASELQKLHDELSAICRDASGLILSLDSAVNEINNLSLQTNRIRVEGVDTRRLQGSLGEAVGKLRAAVDEVHNLQALGDGYAGSLASGYAAARSTVSESSAAVVAPAPDALVDTLTARGLELVDVSSFDFEDNPIGDWNKSEGEENARWAVERWNDSIAPGIAAGATRADFEDYDNRTGAPERRRLANVWDMFLGGDPIKSGGIGPNGKMTVTGGRHRIQAALSAGIRFLPVRP
jgi:hypothetical protein